MGATGSYSSSSMEPWAEFTLCQNGFVARVHLHGELEGKWWVVQVLGCLLKTL